ncbi:hypothetical protein KC363_g2230 [Hortaea werneckii]|uniref:Sodium bile acid symporter family protein n=1 Tax=Hortaea werneckii TaxID=91943 RepID=A0A3M7FF56_HORWE|nr:hypothetical protein KC325_g3831 [Hortaea werneckii]KAI6994570.1 hypothetical protein KC359_g4511 [Hortaea werneckii]KAI7146205.1 hypothetical protein KC344_g3851 [Hortaea werneckii]KAI7175065.1 hypothetical protein KC360_g3861 [Hortaea werneckii]KAI7194264.1 hypothetical protein KC363_g2230 [Hortaea werneckii]
MDDNQINGNPDQTHQPLDQDEGNQSNNMPETQDHQNVYHNKDGDTARHPSTLQTHLRTARSLLQGSWFLISLGLLIAIASQTQVPPSHQSTKTTIINYLCVTLIFLVTGCTIDTQTLLRNYSKWLVHLYVQTACFLLTSGVVFAVVSAVATADQEFMDPGLLVGLIFLGCVPTTISSNVVMTRQARGNTALTVVQTTVGNFLGVFITPALVTMYTGVDTWYNAVLSRNQSGGGGSGAGDGGRFGEIYARVLKQLGLSLYLPLLLGQLLRHFFPERCQTALTRWKLNKLSMLALLVILWQTYDKAFASQAFSSVPGDNMVFVVFVSLGLLVVFLLLSFGTSYFWLPKKDVVAVCYCVPAKGPAMGVPLATTIFAGIEPVLESKILIPIIIYQGLQVALGTILVPVFRKWIERDEARKKTEAESHLEQTGSEPGNRNHDKT